MTTPIQCTNKLERKVSRWDPDTTIGFQAYAKGSGVWAHRFELQFCWGATVFLFPIWNEERGVKEVSCGTNRCHWHDEQKMVLQLCRMTWLPMKIINPTKRKETHRSSQQSSSLANNNANNYQNPKQLIHHLATTIQQWSPSPRNHPYPLTTNPFLTIHTHNSKKATPLQ